MAQISNAAQSLSQGGSKGGNSYSTPTWIGHHPSTSCGAWPSKIRVCASPPFLRILGQPLASNGDLSLVILRQEERPENHRYSRSSLNLAHAEPPVYQSKAGSGSHYWCRYPHPSGLGKMQKLGHQCQLCLPVPPSVVKIQVDTPCRAPP